MDNNYHLQEKATLFLVIRLRRAINNKKEEMEVLVVVVAALQSNLVEASSSRDKIDCKKDSTNISIINPF